MQKLLQANVLLLLCEEGCIVELQVAKIDTRA